MLVARVMIARQSGLPKKPNPPFDKLLLANRQIHDEASRILYYHTHF